MDKISAKCLMSVVQNTYIGSSYMKTKKRRNFVKKKDEEGRSLKRRKKEGKKDGCGAWILYDRVRSDKKSYENRSL